jgi:solute carrier family 35 protein C2
VNDKHTSEVVTVPFFAYPLTAGVLTALVAFIFLPRGFWVFFGVWTYLAALSTMMLTVKWVFATYSFHFPKFLTALHFLCGAIVSATLLVRRKHQEGIPFPMPSWRRFWTLIFPISLAMVASIGSNNMALVHASVAFAEIIASTNCLVVVAMVVLFGMPFYLQLLFPVAIVAVGAVVSISGEINFSLLGFLLCVSAVVFRALKSTLQQKLMTDDTEAKLNPLELLFWVCGPSLAVMLTLSLVSEGVEPYRQILTTERGTLWGMLFAIFVSCVNATVLNLAQLFVTKDLGAVGAQLASQSKSVLTVMGSMVLFGDPVTMREISGFAMVLTGVYIYTRMEQSLKEGAKKKGESDNLNKLAEEDPQGRASYGTAR